MPDAEDAVARREPIARESTKTLTDFGHKKYSNGGLKHYPSTRGLADRSGNSGRRRATEARAIPDRPSRVKLAVVPSAVARTGCGSGDSIQEQQSACTVGVRGTRR